MQEQGSSKGGGSSRFIKCQHCKTLPACLPSMPATDRCSVHCCSCGCAALCCAVPRPAHLFCEEDLERPPGPALGQPSWQVRLLVSVDDRAVGKEHRAACRNTQDTQTGNTKRRQTQRQHDLLHERLAPTTLADTLDPVLQPHLNHTRLPRLQHSLPTRTAVGAPTRSRLAHTRRVQRASLSHAAKIELQTAVSELAYAPPPLPPCCTITHLRKT